MARKVDLDLLKAILTRNELDTRKVAEILEDLQRELDREEDLPKEPQVKKQFVVVASDPEGKLSGVEVPCWVVQLPEEENPLSVPDRLVAAAHQFNGTPRGRKLPVETVGEACEVVSAKFFKENLLWVKTKEPVRLVAVSNRFEGFEKPTL